MVAVSEMTDKLLSIDEVRERISKTEPLGIKYLSGDNPVKFYFSPDWALQLDTLKGTDLVEGFVQVDNKEYALTKDSAMQMGAAFGLPGKYAAKLPNTLLESHLNYWYNDGFGDTSFNLLTISGDTVAALAKPTLTPYSNLNLLDSVLEVISNQYGPSIYADYKFDHSLVKTDIRLIIPEMERAIVGGGLNDVPEGKQDWWSGGIHFTNSLIGKTQTRVEGYLFRWWCTNGATTTMADSNIWSRRTSDDELDVYEWAETEVNSILGALEKQFDKVQALTQLTILPERAPDIIRDVFETYAVPVSQRPAIIDDLVNQENLTMYAVMNAVTRTANDLHPDRADRIMRIGGAIPLTTIDDVKARIWEEGHTSDPDAPNPYELKVA